MKDSFLNHFYFKRQTSQEKLYNFIIALAFKQVKDILKDFFTTVFSNDRNVIAVFNVLKSFVENDRHIFYELDESNIAKLQITLFSVKNIITAISIFNRLLKFILTELN